MSWVCISGNSLVFLHEGPPQYFRLLVVLLCAVWQVLGLVQRLLLEGKMATQREAYYCLVQYFKNQAEFNNTLQGKTQDQYIHIHTVPRPSPLELS